MNLRKLLCLLAVVCAAMLVLALPVAAEETSGSCGENVTWFFDESSGTLTFSGTGEITFNSFSGSPWGGYMAKIQKVIFEKGISSIQDGAFANYSALKQIVFLGDKPTVKLSTFKGVTATAYYPPDNETWAGIGLTNHGGTLYWVAGVPGTAGSCGDNLKWIFQDGVLTISGTGPMYDYGTKSWMPWLDLRNEIVEVMIQPGVGSIGRAAFANCTELKQITIADSVQSIGGQAFLFCGKLTAVSIPDGVIAIDELTFSNCTSLSRIVIPASVAEIYGDAFEGSLYIKKIYFYGNPPVIGAFNMNGCFHVLEAVAYYPADNQNWTEEARNSYGSNITWMANLCVNGHTETNGNAEEAACTQAGLTAGVYCSVCDEELVPSEIIPATGHKEVQDAAKAADCTESGLTAGKHCSVCSEVLVAQQTIPATGHSYGQWKEVKPATTAETGLEERVCGVCGEKEQNTIAKLEPTPTQPTQPATKPTEPPTQPTTAPATKPTEPVTKPTTADPTEPDHEQTTPQTQPADTQPATSAPTQPTTEATVPEQTQDEEPDDNTVVWVVVTLVAAAALASVGIFVFRKYRKK